MNKAIHFEREINLIDNEILREEVRSYMNECVADWFYETGASASGKYHPKFSQGKGGLVRHTKAVVMFAEELLKMSSYLYMPQIYKDYVIAACIIHDTAKYGLTGEMNKAVYKYHAENAAQLFDTWCRTEFNNVPSEFLLKAVRTHMGQWGEEKPFSNIDRCVHMADYMASRNFIDIPTISEEYEKVENSVDKVEEQSYNNIIKQREVNKYENE